ncbi:MAG TPA: hypothetical protein VEG29_00700 [Candidatus Binatia bacterium]|nr:hypothetical protein [Candidatus Binatia bacterium]
MAEEVKKAEDAFKAGYQVGKDFDDATGASTAWGDAAADVDPELAKSAADDWDRGDHAKAVGKFIHSTGEAAWKAGGDFIDGITGHVDAEPPPAIDIPMEPEQIGPVTEVAHETMP